MKKDMGKVFSFWLPLVLSFGLLTWVFSKINLKDIYSVIRTADSGYMLWAAVVFLFINIVILLRWYIVLRALRVDLPFSAVMKWFFIGLFCNFLPLSSVGGDVIKTIGLAGKSKLKPTIFASVVIDRLSGFAGIVVVAAVMFVVGYDQIPDRWVGGSIVVMTLVALTVGAIFFSHRIYSFCCKLFNRWPKLKERVMEVHYDIVLMKGNVAAGLGAVLLSCLAQALLAYNYYIVAKALFQNVSFSYFMIFSPLVCVATTLPSIGGLGLREMGWKYLLPKVGVAPEVAVSISLMNFIFMVGVGFIGGIMYVVTLFDRRVQPRQTDSGVGLQKP